jgi:hypothetical protein
MICQCDKLHTLAQKKRIVGDEYSADFSTDKLCKCWFEVIKVACQRDLQRPPGRTCSVFDFPQQVLIVRVIKKPTAEFCGMSSWISSRRLRVSVAVITDTPVALPPG